MNFDLWLTLAVVPTALLLIPRPTVLLVQSYALSKGRAVALASALGVALGGLVAMTASLVGSGALVLASATVFTILKCAGAVYLIYLGLKLLMSAKGDGLTVSNSAAFDVTGRGVFWHAAVITALNPKSIAFFIAFVPQFITPDTSLAPQFVILIATFVGLAAVSALAYALLAGRLRRQIARPSVIVWLTRASGAALIVMGVLTATLRRAT